MYTKKILSAAAAVAVMSTGAMAFDLDSNGTIYNDGSQPGKLAGNIKATYINGTEADDNLSLSDSMKGDALIYPAFQQKNGWATDIVVRNVKDVAMVAKAVLYRDTDSAELLDFNIYLSAHDVARFTIKDGNVTTKDGSIIGSMNGGGTVSAPYALNDDYAKTAFKNFEANEDGFKTIAAIDDALKVDDKDGNKVWPGGYVIVYGMMQADPTDGNTSIKPEDATSAKVKAATYHNNDDQQSKHEKLFLDYRTILDTCRDDGNATNTIPGIDGSKGKGNWRLASYGQFYDGMMSLQDENGNDVNVSAPNVDANCTLTVANIDSNFTSPSSDAFLGEVEIYKDTGDIRSLLLPATALENYTTDNMMMLWAEGEYAAIQDRRIYGDSTDGNRSDYNITGLSADAKTFEITKAYYTHKAGDSSEYGSNQNALILTQPMKRPLVQAGNKDKYWKTETAHPWGYFEFTPKLYNENEREFTSEAGLINMTSPYNSHIDPDPYDDELQIIANLEEDIAKADDGDIGNYFGKESNGYVDIKIKNLAGNKLPAIVTQMTSNTLGTSKEAQTNWIYAPVDKAQ